MADALQAKLKLAQRPTVITAPPTQDPADLPAVAILLDRHKIYTAAEQELETNAAGEVLIGSQACPASGVGLVELGNGAYLTQIGKMECFGRLFVGARYPASREEVEEQILSLFLEDESAPGMWEFTIKRPTVRGYQLPFDWCGHALLGEDHEWSLERAWTERLWSFLDFTLELPILYPRKTARVEQFIMRIDIDFTQPVVDGEVADLDSGADDELLELNEDGDPIPYEE